LALAADTGKSPRELIRSLQAMNDNAKSEEYRGFENILHQAGNEHVRVCWHDQVLSLDQMEAKCESFHLGFFLWSHITRWLYRKMVKAVFSRISLYQAIFYFLGTSVIIVWRREGLEFLNW
jgi:hypothetical protein